jgi:tRNA threonylcarbamoyladenosine biosynthesis protein TsaB
MMLLAIETSANIGAVCVLRDGVATSEVVRDEVKLSAWIVPAIDRLLSRLDVSLSSLDAIAFGAGPGSFTGARTACATAQALAYAHGKPLIAVSSLEALTYSALSFIAQKYRAYAEINIVLDARMNELYTSTFIVRYELELVLKNAVSLKAPQTVRVDPSAILLGSGAMLIANAHEFDRADVAALTHNAESKWAEGLARIAAMRFAKDSREACGARVDPLDAAPHYVRNDVAKTEAQRAAASQATLAA